jgi:protein-tyrosine-phosphatase
MRYVLFVCAHNAGRSQIAQAFFERHAPADLRAESAGQAPAEAIWPNVIEAMREIGIDLSGRRPKKIDLEMQLHADKAVTLNCQDTCPYVIGGVEDWGRRGSRRTTAHQGPRDPRRARTPGARTARPRRRDPRRP